MLRTNNRADIHMLSTSYYWGTLTRFHVLFGVKLFFAQRVQQVINFLPNSWV
jgi:hypothetical protein